jgi:hypothetical protein
MRTVEKEFSLGCRPGFRRRFVREESDLGTRQDGGDGNLEQKLRSIEVWNWSARGGIPRRVQTYNLLFSTSAAV